MTPTRRELGTIVRLAVPMMGAQGGLMLMGVVDTFVVGRVSSLEMAAVALGNSVAAVITVFGIGLAMGIEPLVSQALGSGDEARARAWLWQGLWLSLAVSLPLAILTAASNLFYEPFGIDGELAAKTTLYVLSRLPGIVFNCTYAALRAYFTSLGRGRPVLFVVAVANVLNVGLDVWLVFGGLGVPALGAVGAGLATSLSWLVMTVLLAWIVWSTPVVDREGRTTHAFARPERAAMTQIARLGWPIGLHFSVEVGIFTLVSALIARFGEAQLAGHQIALTMASLSFMTAVGIANASTARVGYWVGAGDTVMARRTGLVGIALGAAFMGACGLVFLVFAEPIAAQFAPKDPAAREMGAALLYIAAVFSVSDGTQAVSAGVLRGAGDTRWPFYANLAAHWLVAFPLALFLGHELGLGPAGYWWALTAGLTIVAVILVVRFWILSSRPIVRADHGGH
ncbi:MATE family efflux transporter [Myxococcota bacterium]|nr:MATE family efflux transporter [Myxococcota bacterium]